MNQICVLAVCAVLAACATSSDVKYPNAGKYIKQGEELVYCESPYNVPPVILYYKSQVKSFTGAIEIPPAAEPFSTYVVKDVLGDSYFITSDEIKNYECVDVK